GVPPAGGEHALALYHRRADRRRLASLFHLAAADACPRLPWCRRALGCERRDRRHARDLKTARIEDVNASTTAIDIATQFLRRNRRAERQIITPEGVPLTVELADYGERATAFLIDLTIWLIASIAVLLLLLFTPLNHVGGAILVALLLFTAFVVRNLYFIHFELSWYGATPGKRIVGIRVIDRRGGPLLPSAVIARNLTREVEIFIPLGVLISASAAARSGAWEILVLGAWLACFAALVFFNRDRMRAGDLIAGTIVIAM